MTHRVTLLAVVLFSLCALAGAATLPPSPVVSPAPAAVTPPAAVASPSWLLPAPNSSVEKPDVNAIPGKAPLGAIFQSACSQGCESDKISCVNGCAGDHGCIVSCNNDYLCCLRTCNPTGPQCF